VLNPFEPPITPRRTAKAKWELIEIGIAGAVSCRCRSKQASLNCRARDSRTSFLPAGFPLEPVERAKLAPWAQLRGNDPSHLDCARRRPQANSFHHESIPTIGVVGASEAMS
jgi:hypothetical protein